MNHDDELQNLSNFLGGQMKKMHDIMTNKNELYEYASFFKASMNHLFKQDDPIAVDDNGEVDLKAEFATHKIIGIYSTISCERCKLVLLDVITNELYELKL